MRNVEAKLRCDPRALGEVRERAARLGARFLGELRQVDTYFHVPRGRLKLREVRAEGMAPEVWLIGYGRPDHAGARESAYEMVSVADPPALLTILEQTLGVRTRVAKTRSVLFLRHTRIHLDAVDQLGTFVELETLVGERDDRRGGETGTASREEAEREIAEIANALGLSLSDGLAGSYADLLERLAGQDGARQ